MKTFEQFLTEAAPIVDLEDEIRTYMNMYEDKWIDKVGTDAEELVNLVAKKSKKFSKATDDPAQYKKAVKIMNDYLDEQDW